MEAESRTKRHVSIEISQEDEDLALSIKKKMEEVSTSHCVCRVPDFFKQKKENYYVPKLVSIGPFHRGEERLKSKEEQKWSYLYTLVGRKAKADTSLGRKQNVESILDVCVRTLRALEQKSRKCYGEDVHMESNEFLEMLLLDGCFIIELFLKFSFTSLRRRGDTFFNTHEAFLQLRTDMMLLENQIPFFILRELFILVPIPNQCNYSITELALRFFRNMITADVEVLQKKFGQDFHHLLDLIHQCYAPTFAKVKHNGKSTKDYLCATKLQASGIEFKRLNNDCLLNIEFMNGVLFIPPLKIQNYTQVLLWNFMALEHCHSNYTKFVTSYLYFLRCLIQSKEDARLLCRRRILTSIDKEEVVLLLAKIHMEFDDMNEFYYRGLYDQIDDSAKTTANKWSRKLKNCKMLLSDLQGLFSAFCC